MSEKKLILLKTTDEGRFSVEVPDGKVILISDDNPVTFERGIYLLEMAKAELISNKEYYTQ